MHMKGRESFSLKWAPVVTAPLFVADAAMKSRLVTCTKLTHEKSVCVAAPFHIGETENRMSCPGLVLHKHNSSPV